MTGCGVLGTSFLEIGAPFLSFGPRSLILGYWTCVWFITTSLCL